MYAVQPPEPTPMTEVDYLAFEETTDDKHEYSQGRVYAMTGGSVRHSVISANTITHLNNQLDEKDCTVTSSDLRVHVASRKAYRYPDVIVFCGAPAYITGRVDTITNPVVLVEVLSPSTELIDRNDKLAEYTQIESLQAYLMISQNTMKIERFLRHESGQWLYQYVTGLEAEIDLPSLGCTLALSKIYHKVSWDDSQH